VSDLFVKGVIPRWTVVALGLPANLPLEGDFGFDGLIRGLRDGCREYGVQYLGGDLGETGDLTVSMTVGGEIAPNYILRRNNAQSGDILVTTGEWGLTGVGFDILFQRPQFQVPISNQYSRCIEAVLNPQVDAEIGPDLAIHEQAHAGIDSSDGFIRTIIELCSASKTGAIIDWKSIPIPDIVRSYAQEYAIPLEKLALSTGEEFNHIFSISPDKIDAVKRKWGSRLIQIGVLNEIPAKILLQYSKTKLIPLKVIGEGYQHFAK
jgi:thiamine-monophosphate kinase